jgi:hypothetical protein
MSSIARIEYKASMGASTISAVSKSKHRFFATRDAVEGIADC